MAKRRKQLDFVTRPGVDCMVTLDFANGLVVRGDAHSLTVELGREDWPLIDLEMHALEIKFDGNKAEVEDLIRVIRFKRREK